MLSMFAIPTGDDELTSKIEFNSLGQVLANGQGLGNSSSIIKVIPTFTWR